MNLRSDEMDAAVREASAFVPTLLGEINRVLVGQKYLVERLLIGLLANGHVLLEGVPGLAKTLAVKSLAKAIHAPVLPAAIHAGHVAGGRGGDADLQSAVRRVQHAERDRSSRTWCWRMRSTGRRRRCRARCWRRCRRSR
jgi:hypothetical protein